MFPNEYTGVVSAAKAYSPFIVLSVVILGGMGFILRSYGSTPPPLMNALPAAPAAVVKAVNSAVNSALEPFNLSGNSNGKTNGKNGKNQNTKVNGQNLASTSFKVV